MEVQCFGTRTNNWPSENSPRMTSSWPLRRLCKKRSTLIPLPSIMLTCWINCIVNRKKTIKKFIYCHLMPQQSLRRTLFRQNPRRMYRQHHHWIHFHTPPSRTHSRNHNRTHNRTHNRNHWAL